MRKIILGLAVVAMAATTSAFTNAKDLIVNETNLEWFELKQGGDLMNANDYEKVPSEPSCSAGLHRCAIEAVEDIDNPGYPDLGSIQSTRNRTQP